MTLLSVEIRSFRNIESLSLSLGGALHAIWGDNAQGKTNILEAIQFLSTGQSFRTAREEECLPFAAGSHPVSNSGPGSGSSHGPAPAPDSGLGPGAHARATAWIRGRYETGGVRRTVEAAIQPESKTIRLDGKPLARLTELWGLFPSVLFTPGDLELVSGGPSRRRGWMDMALSQTSRPYLRALKRYTSALRQRNALLRRPGARAIASHGALPGAAPHAPHGASHAPHAPHGASSHASALAAQIAAYEPPLAEAAGELYMGRREFAARVSELAARRHTQLAGSGEPLELRYKHFLNELGEGAETEEDARWEAPAGESGENLPQTAREAADAFRGLLESRREHDLQRAQTLRGPHRDDLYLLLNGNEARSYASQGQRRTIALSLRMAEADYIREASGAPPLLLLDDILSEFDAARLEALLTLLAQETFQTIITATSLDPILRRLPKVVAWKVADGRVEARTEE